MINVTRGCRSGEMEIITSSMNDKIESVTEADVRGAYRDYISKLEEFIRNAGWVCSDGCLWEKGEHCLLTDEEAFWCEGGSL